MNYEAAQKYLQDLTYKELVEVYITEYLDWKKTGVLQDGVLRNLHDILSDDGKDESVSIVYTEKLFNEWLAEVFAMQNNDSNSIEDAERLMRLGFKVSWVHFTDNEFLYLGKDGKFYAEDGVCFDDWLEERRNVGFEVFQTNWRIWKDG